LRSDLEVDTGNDPATIAQRLRSGCAAIAQRLRSGCVAIARRLRTILWQLQGNFAAIAQRSGS
jgi:hypothetical protein